jgi:hypothetical protein
MNTSIVSTAVKTMLNGSNGKFLTVTFKKKNGDMRTINGRSGVTKALAGGTRTTDPEKYFTIFEAGNGYRSVNYDTVSEIKMGGQTVRFM